DAFRAEVAGHFAVMRGIGVGADLQRAVLVRPLHDRLERARERRLGRGVLTFHHFAGAAVEPEVVVGAVGLAVDGDGAALGVDLQGAGAGDAGRAHAAGDDRRVRRHAAGAGQDALGDVHAA